jgi:nicotinamide riboside kinase
MSFEIIKRIATFSNSDREKFNNDLHKSIREFQNESMHVEVHYSSSISNVNEVVHSALVIGRTQAFEWL